MHLDNQITIWTFYFLKLQDKIARAEHALILLLQDFLHDKK